VTSELDLPPTLDAALGRLVDQREAARSLRLSVRTLERLRVMGTGPIFCKLGRSIRYRERDLVEWVEQRLKSSTSECADMPLNSHVGRKMIEAA
jgi:hypothetical protein